MKLLLSPARVRSIITGAVNEKDIENALRAHKVRYSYTTAPGYLAIRVPVRSGAVLISRAPARSAPLRANMTPAPGYPFPLPRFTWDD